ncbi:hypothetical protein ACQPW1_36215 [Nocardia sp. CA-128927]|uniref:hypothetical protein n=1 Tax=Nocardia sp. CA-128927 TaxID=3239975 RepID=UPI003D9606F9
MTRIPTIDGVVGYLRGHGWTITGQWRNASVWTWQDFDVLVPPSDVVADATTRLRELVQCVADAEGRSPAAIWRDMTAPAADVVAYRTSADPGSITLPAGARTILAVRDLITFCAQEAMDESGSMRHDIPGSTVSALLEGSLLTLSDGIPGLDIALPIDPDDPDPLGRQTALRLLRGSDAVRQAAYSSDADAFEQIFRQGISPAECEALAELAGPGETLAFELGFHWSWLMPRPEVSVQFPTGAGERIRRGGLRVDPAPLPPVGVVEGPVISLSDDPGSDRWHIRVRGVLVVDGAPVGRTRLVNVSLGDSGNYEVAITAHRDGHTVRAAGTVTGRPAGINVTAAGFTVTDRTDL